MQIIGQPSAAEHVKQAAYDEAGLSAKAEKRTFPIAFIALEERVVARMSSPNGTGSDEYEMRDPERPPLKHRETHESTYTRPYTNYAHWIGREPTFAIFRRFASLNALNLLALQAEISHEEHELHTLQLDDVEFDNHTNFMRLIEADKDSNAGKQWQQILKLRPMLKQYSKC